MACPETGSFAAGVTGAFATAKFNVAFRGREGVAGRGCGAGDSLTGSLAGDLEEAREDEGNGEAEED